MSHDTDVYPRQLTDPSAGSTITWRYSGPEARAGKEPVQR
jgi:hypothetical protein